MADSPSARSVKIPQDERGGWSSDRPRKQGAVRRPDDLTVRCQVLAPSDRVRYSPGSLVVLVAPDASAGEEFLARVIEDKPAVLTTTRVRRLLAGRVGADELAERADAVLESAVRKRLESGEAVVLGLDDAGPETRERWVRIAAPLRRPRHLILLESPGADEDLTELRRALMAGDLGAEGFNTAMRLSGSSIPEVKRIVFRPQPQDD